MQGGKIWIAEGSNAAPTTPLTLDNDEFVNLTSQSFAIVNGRLLFFTGSLWTDDFTGDLWTSDGTPEGTMLIASITPLDLRDGQLPLLPLIRPTAERAFFLTSDGVWSTDGTREGTRPLQETLAQSAEWSPSLPTALNDRLLFSAYDVEHGRELWMTDGTIAGTRLVADVLPGPASSEPELYGKFEDVLVFTADDGVHGRELWALDLHDMPETSLFHRGDPNSSGTTNISDGIAIFGFLFLGGPAPTCSESADVNNNGEIDITDGISLLNWLFLGGPPPAAPGPPTADCGVDPDAPGSPGDLGCEAYGPCS
jgi:ELWxxDGT repeat protein